MGGQQTRDKGSGARRRRALGLVRSDPAWRPSQVINQPIVRGTITIQDPGTKHPNLMSALSHIYRTRGAAGLWHGTGASVLKTVPKYVTAIWVKDTMQDILPKPTAGPGEPGHRSQVLWFSAVKSVAAGVAGAALTNPLDVIRNEMFKTDESTLATTRRLLQREGLAFVYRGMGRNLVAVAAPIGMTIFLTDAISDWRLSLSAERAQAALLGTQPQASHQLEAQGDVGASARRVAGAVLRKVSTGTMPQQMAAVPSIVQTHVVPPASEHVTPLEREV